MASERSTSALGARIQAPQTRPRRCPGCPLFSRVFQLEREHKRGNPRGRTRKTVAPGSGRQNANREALERGIRTPRPSIVEAPGAIANHAGKRIAEGCRVSAANY